MNGVGLIASILLAIFFIWLTCLKISLVAHAIANRWRWRKITHMTKAQKREAQAHKQWWDEIGRDLAERGFYRPPAPPAHASESSVRDWERWYRDAGLPIPKREVAL
jgi:hypothetical protein